jgi:hypothetical protein
MFIISRLSWPVQVSDGCFSAMDGGVGEEREFHRIAIGFFGTLPHRDASKKMKVKRSGFFRHNPANRATERQAVMETTTQSAPVSLPQTDAAAKRAHVEYQVVTVAAILLVLGSLWVF